MKHVDLGLTQCAPQAFENIRRKELIEEYKTKQVREFIQFDGFANQSPIDYVMRADEDGDSIMWHGADELRNTSHEVRLSIPVGTKKADVIRLVRKILKQLEEFPHEHIIELKPPGQICDFVGKFGQLIQATRQIQAECPADSLFVKFLVHAFNHDNPLEVNVARAATLAYVEHARGHSFAAPTGITRDDWELSVRIVGDIQMIAKAIGEGHPLVKFLGHAYSVGNTLELLIAEAAVAAYEGYSPQAESDFHF